MSVYIRVCSPSELQSTPSWYQRHVLLRCEDGVDDRIGWPCYGISEMFDLVVELVTRLVDIGLY